jgi:hypothetical protein
VKEFLSKFAIWKRSARETRAGSHHRIRLSSFPWLKCHAREGASKKANSIRKRKKSTLTITNEGSGSHS